MSGAAFCRARGLSRATFTLWQREARDAKTARVSPRPRSGAGFARVDVVGTGGPAPHSPGAGVAGPTMTMVVRGHTGLEAELTGVDAATAERLVRLVVAWAR